ncbi:MAG TPA: hypothetical protein VHY22_10850 [Chthoniobacteraceae bacterium]|jgi:hypothetical protein|nr:hypothetical protein [Chthoniobacteraceae bacterium]
MSERQISSASSGQVKVDMLAEGAMNNILGDLKEEISAGSIVTTGSVAGSGTSYTYCTPAFQWAAVPCVSGTTAGANWLPPNVLKRSAYNQPFYTGTSYVGVNNFVSTTISGSTVTSSTSTVAYTPSNRAAMVSSTAAALNGRYVSLERWNKALLIPTLSGTSTQPQLSGTMPDGTNWAYAAPDWVLVDRSGNNPTPAAGPVPGPLEWSSTSSTAVVGRYAYTIYDEGGLLDMNVAGHPSSVSGTTASVKSSLAMADLTQIGLTPQQIDAIVTNWRNQATAQQTGNFRDNMLQVSETNGFLGVNPTVAGDSAFPSRQSLINFLLQNVAATGTAQAQLQNALQYMGTFSRSIEAPSFSPNPNRPRIINPSATPPPATAVDGYAGNNDAAGADDLINVPFLSARVTNTFQRMDGSVAQIGEPLVKKRFPLSRLAWITYGGPSQTATPAIQTALQNVGVSQTTINSGSAQAIMSAFGLQWTGTTGTWTYYHGASHIMTLPQVAALNPGREPDFAELLKAAINVGSLGKAAPNLPGGGTGDYEYQYILDSSVDYNILQIMANLIDQVTPDSYPIVIQIASGSTYRQFRGVEDIPYFYRFLPFSVVTAAPNILVPTNATSITLPGGVHAGIQETVSSAYGTADVVTSTGTGTLTLAPVISGSLAQSGTACMFYVPEVWDPHDGNEAIVNPANRPSQFQIELLTDDPAGATPFWQTTVESPNSPSNSGSTSLQVISGSNPIDAISPLTVLNPNTNSSLAMQFSDNSGQLFREPTLLWRPNLPTGSSLTGGTNATDANTGLKYIGMPLGAVPAAVQLYISGTVASASSSGTGVNMPYVLQGTSIEQGPVAFPGSSGQNSEMYTFRLQYKNPNPQNGPAWITYDEKYADNHNIHTPTLVVNKNDTTDWPDNLWENPLPNIDQEGDGQLGDMCGVHDPLTARFGVGLSYFSLGKTSINGTNGSFVALPTGFVPEPTVSQNWPPVFNTWWNGAGNPSNSGINRSNFTIMETDRPRTDLGAYVNLSNPCMCSDPGNNAQMRWFSGVGFYTGGGSTYANSPLQFDGLISQNNPAITFESRGNGTAQSVAAQLYYEDADGVARRAMGAYADTRLLRNGDPVGLPEVTADSFPAVSSAISPEGVPTPLASGQSESRPIILNRPFRSVAEMSYASRGLPWKNIDFFTPESADTALLDVFCVNELPASNIVAGKVNLNTRQPLVLQAILAGAYVDEFKNLPNPPTSITGTAALSSGTTNGVLGVPDAAAIALTQVERTIDTTNYWHGPLANIGEIVGRYVTTLPGTTGTASFNDPYTYIEPAFPPGQQYPPWPSATPIIYSGLSGALSSSGTNGTMTSTLFVSNSNTALIQRGRESAIRPLVDCGQTRVWNLMIDVVAQSGRYPQGAGDLTKFQVEGEKRYWVHVAVDRWTGAIIDKQVEVVTE